MSGASSEQARVIETLNCIIDVERAKGRTLSALDLVLARDAVEVAADLLAAITAHRFDTQHIIDRGAITKPRLADVMLYERAGLEPVVAPCSSGPRTAAT